MTVSIPINPFRAPLGAFPVPIPVIDAEPDDNLVYVGISFDWMPAVLGCMGQLLQQATWDTDDPEVMALVLMRASQLLYQMSNGQDLSVLCGDCVAWSHEFDFCDAEGWVNISPGTQDQGLLIPCDGWFDTFTSGYGRGIAIHNPISAPFLMTSFTVDYAIGVGTLSSTALNRIYSDVNPNMAHQYQPATGSGSFLLSWSGLMSVRDISVAMLCGYTAGGGDGHGDINIRSITVTGFGADPF